jgi:hypothetical protein
VREILILGTRIPSAQTTTTTSIPTHLTNSSSNVFRSKHCVSREDDSPTEMNEPHIINDEPLEIPTKRIVQVRIDHYPTMAPSMSPSPDMIPMPVNSDLSVSDNSALVNESTIIKSIDDSLNESFEYNSVRRSKSAFGPHVVTLPPIPSSNISLMNNRKDPMNLSHSSFSTSNSNQPHIVTGSSVIVRQRSPTKSVLSKQRIKSTPHQTNIKTRFVCFLFIIGIAKKQGSFIRNDVI